MTLTVREMMNSEVDVIIEYFFKSTPEHLDMLGVDPTRLPTPENWRERFRQDYAQPIEQRARIAVIWLSSDQPIAFRPPTRSVMASKPTCICMSPNPNVGTKASEPKGCGAASRSISSG